MKLKEWSRPAWDAWIEIMLNLHRLTKTSRPAWDAWIEIISEMVYDSKSKSRPAWDAWIEINVSPSSLRLSRVASRMGRVD